MQTWKTEEPADTCWMKVDVKKINWLDHDRSSLDKLPRPARSGDKKVTRDVTIKKICFSAPSPVSVK